MGFTGFPKATLAFLRGLEKNNDKAWFDAHRAEYDAHYLEPAKELVAAIGPRLQKLSPSVQAVPKVNGSIFRINRDVRFSKDKSPYKPHLDLWFWDGKGRSWDCPGFFFRLQPRQLILGAGMHRLDKKLGAFRKAVVDDKRGKALQGTLSKLERAGYKVGEPEYKRVPRGFDPDHPRAELLRLGGVVVTWEGPLPDSLHSARFVGFCSDHFKKMNPVHQWLLAL